MKSSISDDYFNEFYSNCLFEAIKAKLKDPKNIKIHYVGKELVGSTHFYWYDFSDIPEIYGVWSFTHKTKLKQKILFKGFLTWETFNMWESFLFHAMNRKGFTEEQKITYAKKHGFVHKKPFKWGRLPEKFFD